MDVLKEDMKLAGVRTEYVHVGLDRGRQFTVVMGIFERKRLDVLDFKVEIEVTLLLC